MVLQIPASDHAEDIQFCREPPRAGTGLPRVALCLAFPTSVEMQGQHKRSLAAALKAGVTAMS